ncbi:MULTISPECIES: DNA polymerase III subunit beta [unclassified Streptococcus]|uniref:DNA polymerase III subunit beta n=1 Tax=unclassified Streptococcus TaxID=2608887 RepID=UPI0018ABAA96|nr:MULTISPECIES: DNA polymerase III subunit beta [unclassified Streptococcus]MBF8970783.1 DNA polymerase III subunit beta [Streptococcus sp. NLN76]MBG9367446.1 DNA polymerase III subunit beta [Streptococcus sp. NLN64]
MLQFSINKNFFLQALNTVKRAISSKNAIPILSTLKIEAHAEGVILIGSNGQISIENFIPVEQKDAGLVVDQPGSLLLEATFFINVISSLPSLELDLKEIENKQLLLKSGKSEITLKGKDSNQYPRIQEIPTSNPLLLETKVLKELISETAFAASSQESRPILTGVHFVLDENKQLKTVATDSHRLSQKIIQLENAGDAFDVVIPSKSLKEFTAVFGDEITSIEVFFAQNQLLFKSEYISFYIRLLEGNYPDTNRLIPTMSNSQLTFNVVQLRQAMERARLLSNATQNGTVKVEIKDQTVRSYVNSPEVGQVDEELEVLAIEGEDLSISFNPNYMIEALKAIKSEEVILSFISPIRPFTLKAAEEDQLIQLITPVRTN